MLKNAKTLRSSNKNSYNELQQSTKTIYFLSEGDDYMNLTNFQQYGMAAIFIAIAIYLYRDMRTDKSATLKDAKDREDRLMQTLEKDNLFDILNILDLWHKKNQN